MESPLKVIPIANNSESGLHHEMRFNGNKSFSNSSTSAGQSRTLSTYIFTFQDLRDSCQILDQGSTDSPLLLPENSRRGFPQQEALSLLRAKRLLDSQSVVPIVETIPDQFDSLAFETGWNDLKRRTFREACDLERENAPLPSLTVSHDCLAGLLDRNDSSF